MMMLSPLLRSGVCLAATFVTSSVVGFGSAYADEPDSKARAQALFLEGRDAIDGGDWATGCPKIRASLELFVVANSHFTLAQCNERDGKLASALEHWERGLELVGPTDQRAGVAKEHIATLEPHVPRLRVIVPPVSGHAQVFLDDVELTAAVLSTPLRVDPGKHVLLVRAEGRRDNRTEISVIEAEKKEVMAYIGPPSDEVSGGLG
ncbi:MAG TPA: hypothetical protein PK156_50195, partial [Polyangium sp.]|nr:hypothetical protein [Polyangium sp.]